MTEDFTIRPFESRDLPRLQEIRAAAFEPVFRSFRQIVGERIAVTAFAQLEREQASLLDSVCGADSSHELFVVERGGAVVAFCTLSLDRETKVGEIGLNAVDPAHQGAGIGTRMYETALERMRAAGMRVATVGTGGEASHAPARRAYEKAGFGPAIPSLYLYRAL